MITAERLKSWGQALFVAGCPLALVLAGGLAIARADGPFVPEGPPPACVQQPGTAPLAPTPGAQGQGGGSAAARPPEPGESRESVLRGKRRRRHRRGHALDDRRFVLPKLCDSGVHRRIQLRYLSERRVRPFQDGRRHQPAAAGPRVDGQ